MAAKLSTCFLSHGWGSLDCKRSNGRFLAPSHRLLPASCKMRHRNFRYFLTFSFSNFLIFFLNFFSSYGWIELYFFFYDCCFLFRSLIFLEFFGKQSTHLSCFWINLLVFDELCIFFFMDSFDCAFFLFFYVCDSRLMI